MCRTVRETWENMFAWLMRRMAWSGLLTGWDSRRKPFLTFAVGVRARLSMPAWWTSLDVWFAHGNSQYMDIWWQMYYTCDKCVVVVRETWENMFAWLMRRMAWSGLLTGWDSRRTPFLTFAVGVRARLSMPAWWTSLDVWFAHGNSQYMDIWWQMYYTCDKCVVVVRETWGNMFAWLMRRMAWSGLLTGWDSRRKPFLTFAVGVWARLSMPAWWTSLDVWFEHGNSQYMDIWWQMYYKCDKCVVVVRETWENMFAWLMRRMAWSGLLTGWDSRRKPFLTFAVGVRARLSMPAWWTSLDVWFAHGNSQYMDIWWQMYYTCDKCVVVVRETWENMFAWLMRRMAWSGLLAGWDSRRKPFLTFAVGVRARLSMPAWWTSLDVWFAHGNGQYMDIWWQMYDTCDKCVVVVRETWENMFAWLMRCMAWSGLLTGWDSRRKPFLTFAVGVRARLSMPAWWTSLDVWFAHGNGQYMDIWWIMMTSVWQMW